MSIHSSATLRMKSPLGGSMGWCNISGPKAGVGFALSSPNLAGIESTLHSSSRPLCGPRGRHTR